MLLLLSFFSALVIGSIDIHINEHQKDFSGVVIVAKENYYLYQDGLKRFYVYEEDNKKEVGDFLKIKGFVKKLDFATFESSFDFNKYLNNKGVTHQLVVKKEDIKFKTVLRKKVIKNYFLKDYDDNNLLFINYFLFGKYDKGDTTYLKAKNTQLFYLFTTSATHLNFILYIFNKLLNKCRQIKNPELDTLILFIPFFIFLDFKIAIFRIFLYRLLNLFSSSKTPLTRLSNLSLSMIILLLLDYHFIYNMGFVCGYMFSFIALIGSESFKHLSKSKKKISMVILFTMVAFILNWYLNYQINILVPFLSLISFIFSILFLLTFICYLFRLHFIISFLSNIYGTILTFYSNHSLLLVVGEISSLILVLLIILIGKYIISIEHKEFKKTKLLVFIYVFTICLSSIPYKNYLYNSISFINVGQGDCILIQNKTTNILVDTGGNLKVDLATEALIPYFKKRKIDSLDYVFITHGDFDHCGALPSLEENFKVKKVIKETKEFFTIKDISFHNLNYQRSLYEDENNKSLVFYFTFMNQNWLLMGDAEIDVEKAILQKYRDIHVDILKAGHHGSNTSSCYEFISFLKPKEAIISVGKNHYGHPSEKVLETLTTFNVKIRRTDIEGTIKYQQFAYKFF